PRCLPVILMVPAEHHARTQHHTGSPAVHALMLLLCNAPLGLASASPDLLAINISSQKFRSHLKSIDRLHSSSTGQRATATTAPRVPYRYHYKSQRLLLQLSDRVHTSPSPKG